MKSIRYFFKTLLLALALAAVGGGLTGCSKVNRENYDKLKMGMGYEEVVQILGEPEQCDAMVGVKSCTWGKAPKTITIQLLADKVILYQSEGL
jgi:hypothetical protein